MTEQTVAAIDCGTNSVRLLIAQLDADGVLVDLQERKTRINRLGHGVDKTRKFDSEALRKTFEFEEEFALDLKKFKVLPENIRFIATSASRDAQNREEFFERTYQILGVTPEVIPGSEEASLSFAGVVSAVHNDDVKVVVDLGGGSTELILGINEPVAAFSMNVGSVRITERHFANLSDNEEFIPSVDQIESALVDINLAIDEAFSELRQQVHNASVDVSLELVAQVVGVAGTVTTLTAAHLELPAYSRDAVDGASMTLEQSYAACNKILQMKKGDLRGLGFVHPGRIDVIQAGALVWRTVLERLHELSNFDNITCSEHDILDGVALSLAANPHPSS
jgi:exopolyphosphatase/guanosine-5'-triphosphate,3'-diphosphate pyrophosphatase